ncbi:MAG: T9SS type A sorting domain-containing protein [Bacteroidetes bacterium]|nr:T9SS type A sorting domain-containing protein [Bacteroidota bacterium]
MIQQSISEKFFDEFHSIATLYPNPATSSFKIITELQNNNLQIELYNFLGNKVLGRSIDSRMITQLI